LIKCNFFNEFDLFTGVSRDVSILRDSLDFLDISGNPIKFIALDYISASATSLDVRFLKFLKFRHELNLTTFLVCGQFKVTANGVFINTYFYFAGFSR